MCGITGFIDFSKRLKENDLEQMTDCLIHRGPDDSGTFFKSNGDCLIGLGQRRLSILDLTPLGHQPFISSCGNFTIVYNGEVYNFLSIQKELKSLGYHFRSNSDTEVILYAFQEWGVESVHKFIGMFAFAIYSKKKNKVYIFRDRAGVKPLYYYYNNRIFLFASELKAFSKNSFFKKEINRAVLPLYMIFGYIPAPHTIFRKCHKLLPGHYLEFNLSRETFQLNKYWDINNFYNLPKFNYSEDKIITDLEFLFHDAFNLRMVSDVPVGIFLSGGYDSSLVTAILKRHIQGDLKTFTIGFNESGFDESKYARKIAAHLGTDHEELICKRQDIKGILYNLPEIYDEPFADDSAIPSILLSQMARKNVKVALSADGGDEQFFGYSKYFALMKLFKYCRSNKSQKALSTLLRFIPPKAVVFANRLLPSRFRQMNIKAKYEKFTSALQQKSIDNIIIHAAYHLGADHMFELMPNSFLNFDQTAFERLFAGDNLSPGEKMQALDYETFLPDDVLVKVDRATMSVSLEGREPLLDHRISEYAAQIPLSIKYKDGSGKYLLKQIAHRYIPEKLLARPKSGFHTPLLSLVKDEIDLLIDTYLSKEMIINSNIFNYGMLEKYITHYKAGKDINFNIIWHILQFQMWNKRWG